MIEPGLDWNTPEPDVIPAPTFWPAGMAVAITFLLLGMITSLLIVVVGFVGFVVCLAAWIGEMRHEARRA